MTTLAELGLVALEVFNILILVYFAILNLIYLATTLFAFRELKRYSYRSQAIEPGEPTWAIMAPPVTVLVPVHNEGATCVETVRALLTLVYPRHDVIVVDDGSTDDTSARLKAAFDFRISARAPTAMLPTAEVQSVFLSQHYPNLWLVQKENGGKADALNAGINLCHTPLFCTIDGDTLVEREALLRMVRPFLFDVDTVAAGGVVRVVNGCVVEEGMVREVRMPRNILAGLQVVEYLRAFLIGRVGWAEAGSTLIISGAFGMFRRDVVVGVGGYSTATVGEDMELVVRIHRRMRDEGRRYRVSFVADPVAWTQAPASLAHLAQQRDRWQRGIIQSLMMHRQMLLRPKYGVIGMVAYPFFVCLEMVGPVIEFLGYVAFGLAAAFGLLSTAHILVFFVLAVGLGMALSVGVLALEELTFRRYSRLRDLLRLFVLAVVENLGYRQLITYFRIRGTISAIRGRKEWGHTVGLGFREGEIPG